MATKRPHVPVEMWYVSRLSLCLMLILTIDIDALFDAWADAIDASWADAIHAHVG